YLLLILSFLGIVLLGSLLLSMPFSFRNNPDNEWCHVGNYLDAFFTALSAMSQTGITTYPAGLADTLSVAGQIIVIILVQIGGLGIVTILTFLFTLFRRTLEFKNRLFISQAISFNNFSEIVGFVRNLMIITVICEVVGFGLGIPVYIQIFPDNIPKALYYSLFYSISSFNNAGFDLSSGTTSFLSGIITLGGIEISATHWLYYYSTIYMAVLSLLGGVGFLVIIEVVLGHKPPRLWSSFTKIILLMTFGGIALFSLILFFIEGFKANTPMTYYECLMQIINCRTAGFTVYPQERISLPGRMVCCIMMFIGGSPLSTAGGIKVTTVFIIVLSIVSYFRGKRMSAFKRRYSEDLVAKSMSLVFIVLFLLILAFMGLALFGTKDVEGYPLSDNIKDNLVSYYLYEVFSFYGNVGFYTG
ncbi:MAG: hypothetical protein J5666_07895, partial [Bacilli bacterium]|nr:hypothetical protein [Bacilli bacterium]